MVVVAGVHAVGSGLVRGHGDLRSGDEQAGIPGGVVLGEAWTASLSVQVPVTARRDFDVAGGVGVEARF